MDACTAGTVFGVLIFFTVAYVLQFRFENKRWPKIRNPFF